MTRYFSLLSPVLVLLLAGCASTPNNAGNICAMFEDRRAWYRAAKRTEERWEVPVPVTMAFIRQESGFRARVRPARSRILGFIPGPRPSNAMGYAQALESTWTDYQRATGNQGARRSSFSDAVDFVGWYNHNSYRINRIGRADAYHLYLAYHEGNAGFSRGTYTDKQWLLDAATRVQANADTYAVQYARCEQELERNWFLRLLF